MITLFPVTFSDLDAITQLAAESSAPYAWTHLQFAASLAAGHTMLLARDGNNNGALVGYAVWMQALDEIELLDLAIIPSMRRCGIASHLLAALIHTAHTHAVIRILLEVRASNLGAQALYHTHGFQEMGRRHAYYRGESQREDAVLMERLR